MPQAWQCHTWCCKDTALLLYSWLAFGGWGKKVLCSTLSCFLEILWEEDFGQSWREKRMCQREKALWLERSSLCQGVGTRWKQTKQAQTIQELQVAQVISELRVHVTGAAASGGELLTKASTGLVAKGLY